MVVSAPPSPSPSLEAAAFSASIHSCISPTYYQSCPATFASPTCRRFFQFTGKPVAAPRNPRNAGRPRFGRPVTKVAEGIALASEQARQSTCGPAYGHMYDALKRMSVIREGFVTRNPDGTAKGDGQVSWVIARICRRAGLPVRYWHTLRHSFGTHAALLGVNPWRLQTWMGHKRIDETMLYVHVAENHRRDIPESILLVAENEREPDQRVLKMLGARGSHVAAKPIAENKSSNLSVA